MMPTWPRVTRLTSSWKPGDQRCFARQPKVGVDDLNVVSLPAAGAGALGESHTGAYRLS